MFRSLTGKEVEISYFVGGGSVTGTDKVKGIITSTESHAGEFFIIIDDQLMINGKYYCFY